MPNLRAWDDLLNSSDVKQIMPSHNCLTFSFVRIEFLFFLNILSCAPHQSIEVAGKIERRVVQLLIGQIGIKIFLEYFPQFIEAFL
jgi:hypothetical protein